MVVCRFRSMTIPSISNVRQDDDAQPDEPPRPARNDAKGDAALRRPARKYAGEVALLMSPPVPSSLIDLPEQTPAVSPFLLLLLPPLLPLY